MTTTSIPAQREKTGAPGTPLPFRNALWIFVIGCLIGAFVECLFCIFIHGKLELRQATIYGPFNLVYGFGALAMTLTSVPASQRYRLPIVFLVSALAGGLTEYLSSFLQEAVFQTQSWDFSDQTFNLHGRTSLLFMLFWGALGTVFARFIYPFFIAKISKKSFVNSRGLAMAMTVFMVANIGISAIAVNRWIGRLHGQPAQHSLDQYIDNNYGDARMEHIYPNMKLVSMQSEAHAAVPLLAP